MLLFRTDCPNTNQLIQTLNIQKNQEIKAWNNLPEIETLITKKNKQFCDFASLNKHFKAESYFEVYIYSKSCYRFKMLQALSTCSYNKIER